MYIGNKGRMTQSVNLTGPSDVTALPMLPGLQNLVAVRFQSFIAVIEYYTVFIDV